MKPPPGHPAEHLTLGPARYDEQLGHHVVDVQLPHGFPDEEARRLWRCVNDQLDHHPDDRAAYDAVFAAFERHVLGERPASAGDAGESSRDDDGGVAHSGEGGVNHGNPHVRPTAGQLAVSPRAGVATENSQLQTPGRAVDVSWHESGCIYRCGAPDICLQWHHHRPCRCERPADGDRMAP